MMFLIAFETEKQANTQETLQKLTAIEINHKASRLFENYPSCRGYDNISACSIIVFRKHLYVCVYVSVCAYVPVYMCV